MKKNRIAMAMQISRMAVWKIEQQYQKWGEEGLKGRKPGRLFQPLNSKFYQLVVNEWKENKCGARKLHVILKKKGFSVSLRKISQVMIKEGLQKPCLKRRKPRKYKRYEWPIPNYMWHTDWHTIKAKKLKGENIIVYIDDCSRKVMGYTLGAMTTKNSLFALYAAITKNLVTPFSLNSDRGTQFIPNKFDKKGKANHAFQEALKELGILLIHPKEGIRRQMESWRGFLGYLIKSLMNDLIHWISSSNGTTATDSVKLSTI